LPLNASDHILQTVARDGAPPPCQLSVVIPVFDEAESVERLFVSLASALTQLNMRSEVVFIDDGSRDATLSNLSAIAARDPRVRVISLRRNFGKTAALLAGFQEATGDVIVTMDGDLQDDPKELPRFLAAIEGGYDLMSGWKRKRRDPLSKTLPSRLFNLTVRRTTGIPLHDFNCGYKAYRHEVLDELKLYGELHRFTPVMAYWRGYRVGELEVQHHPRQFGRSKFGVGRLFKGLLDFVKVLFLTRYLQRPLQLFGLLGILLLLAGVAGFAYLFVLKLLGQSVFSSHGPLLFLSGILIVSGLQLFMLGLIGEMLRHYSFHPDDEYSVKARVSGEDLDRPHLRDE
jgi:glycosyltransferase involved in cell wall biosynthesis